MPDSVAISAQIYEDLIKKYHNLPELERQMIQVVAIAYEPIDRDVILTCLRSCGVTTANQQNLTTSHIKPHLERLVNARFFNQSRSQLCSCPIQLIDIAVRDAVKSGNFEQIVEGIEAAMPVRSYGQDGRMFSSESQFVREVRIGIYRQDMEFVVKQFNHFRNYYSYSQSQFSIDSMLRQVCSNPFDREWMRSLAPNFYEIALPAILSHGFNYLQVTENAIALLREDFNNASEHFIKSSLLISTFVVQNLWRGDLSLAFDRMVLKPVYALVNLELVAWQTFLKGELKAAIAQFREALKILRKAKGKRNAYFNGEVGIFFILALIKDGTNESLREAEAYAELMSKQTGYRLYRVYLRLQRILKFQLGDPSQKELLSNEQIQNFTETSSTEAFFSSLCLYWINPEQAKFELPRILSPLYKHALDAGYLWLAMETATILGKLAPESLYSENAQELRTKVGAQTIVDLIQPQEVWEVSLNALLNLSHVSQDDSYVKDATNSIHRLVWLISIDSYGYKKNYSIQPKEQKINARGEWSLGRNIALKRLKENTSELGYLTPQDLKICFHIVVVGHNSYYGSNQFEIDEEAIYDLVGHPLVFWQDSPSTRVEIVKGEPELLVRTGKNDSLILAFSPPVKDAQKLVITKETPTRIKVTPVTEEHRRITEIIGKQNRLEIPAIAKDRVLKIIHGIAAIVTVHSDIGGTLQNTEEVQSDSKLHVHILPAGSGLKVALLVRPFGNGAYYRAGAGGATVVAEIEGKRLQTTRDLQAEELLAKEAILACPVLDTYPEHNHEWIIEDPETCLELLLELQDLGDRIILEWPEGEKLRIRNQLSFSHFRMSIRQNRDWFAAEGELRIDDDQVLNMQQVLALLDKSSSRFIPLGDGQFMALTAQFRKHLDEFRRLSAEISPNSNAVKFHPLAAIALEDFVDQVEDLKVDRHWQEHLRKVKQMRAFEPQLPSTLQAELRDYQLEGFQWLARLAHWGVGACLADDMGLGKTIQSLALILSLAPKGATLIVAPTSVCMNWISEAEKFAPTLNVIVFGTGDRQKVLDRLQPFDMVVCSYGLLQQDEVGEMLAQVSWQTVVLDEAQAIKNIATKRSQAAMNLQSKFKLITTGTPIENHLGELWNLFRFINPGLLGSLEQFNTNYANPIERSQDRDARQQLKKLIQPFILRRTKNQVLQELPSRTEVTLQVELSKEERAFYESLRREAIAKLTDSDVNAGQRHLQVLTEIMKLRRACCHSKLVRTDIALPSAKLQLFGEVLEELLDNHHKALVFSQFVDHLHIIRDYLDSQGIDYQYLDGSTPTRERKKRVDAFQSGEGDVFLISLKAGGTGLNLTAADYVIHMDPWWNPAVEDQASDRAHRIGQKRPVTIYRLVAKDTIEEKIVELHNHKRDLADSLLEGTNISGKVTTEALLKLISEI